MKKNSIAWYQVRRSSTGQEESSNPRWELTVDAQDNMLCMFSTKRKFVKPKIVLLIASELRKIVSRGIGAFEVVPGNNVALSLDEIVEPVSTSAASFCEAARQCLTSTRRGRQSDLDSLSLRPC